MIKLILTIIIKKDTKHDDSNKIDFFEQGMERLNFFPTSSVDKLGVHYYTGHDTSQCHALCIMSNT